MRIILYLLLILISFGNHLCAQGFKMNFSNSFADCFGAIEVYSYDEPAQIQFPGNFGQRDDFVALDPDFHEVNSVWLRLEPRVEGTFEFSISTENNVDFSYLLFKANHNSFCEDLEADRVRPIINTATSYREKGAATIPKSPEFVEAIETGEDDVYYLMIHTNSTYKGRVNVQFRRIGNVAVTKSVIQDYRSPESKNFLRVKIRDRESGEPVAANMIITGVKKDNYLFLGTDFLFDACVQREMHIETNTQGYFLFSKDFETKNARDKNTEILLELDRLSPGKKLALENIKFQQDSDEFLPIAAPALKRLLDFMALNDELKVEIQGHVNAPGYKNNNKIKSLSEDRAKAVKKYLKDNGIDADRIRVVGYGNTQMIYEKPKAVWQEEANRRVEIEVVE